MDKKKNTNKAIEDIIMPTVHVTWQFFEASGRHEDFFEKTKKTIFRLGQWEYVFQISGLYHFSFGQET